MKGASRGLEGGLKPSEGEGGFERLEGPFNGASRRQGGLKGASRRLEAFSAEGGLEEGLKGFMFRRLEGGLIRNGLLRYIIYTCTNLM